MRLIQQVSEVANRLPVFKAIQEIKKHCRTLYKQWHHGHIFEDFLKRPWLVSMSISADILFLKDGPLLRALGNCSKKKHGSMSDVPRIIPSMPSPKVALVLLAAQVTCAINLQKSDLVNFWIPCGSVIRKAWAGTKSILGIHERNWHGLDTWCFQLTFPRLFQDLGLWCVWRSGKKHHSVHLLQMNTQQSSLTPQYEGWTCTLRLTRYPKRNALK